MLCRSNGCGSFKRLYLSLKKDHNGISGSVYPTEWIKRAERLKELLEHPANRKSFNAWKVCIGATQEMVKHILGNPKDKNIKQLKNKRREYWYYKGRKTNQGGTVYSYRVRLEDGVVTEFETESSDRRRFATIAP